jgi:hypothetical protein
MRELLSWPEYVASSRSPAWRSVVVMSVLWGGPMTGIIVITQGREIGIVPALMIGIITGVLFGTLWTVWFRLAMRRFVRRVYHGDPKLVPQPPEGGFEARVPCNLLLTDKMAVGGHLYLGRDQSVFVPHNRNLRQHRSPVVLTPGAHSAVTVHELTPPLLTRILAKGPIQVFDVNVAEGSVRLLVPKAESVLPKLEPFFKQEA